MADCTERDQFLYRQLKGNRSLHIGLMVLYGVVAIAAAAMAFPAYGARGIGALVFLAMFAIGAGITAYNEWSQYKWYSAALKEIGDDPAGLDTCKTYSTDTVRLIAMMRQPPKTFMQQFIAYGLIAVMLLGMGIMLGSLMIGMGEESFIYYAVAGGMVVGGLILLVLAIRAFVDWRGALRLESMPE